MTLVGVGRKRGLSGLFEDFRDVDWREKGVDWGMIGLAMGERQRSAFGLGVGRASGFQAGNGERRAKSMDYKLYFPPQALAARTSMAVYLSSQVVYIAPTTPGTAAVFCNHCAMAEPSSSLS